LFLNAQKVYENEHENRYGHNPIETTEAGSSNNYKNMEAETVEVEKA